MGKNKILYKKKYPIKRVILLYLNFIATSVLLYVLEIYEVSFIIFIFSFFAIYIANLYTGTIYFHESYMIVKRYGGFFILNKRISYKDILNVRVYDGIRGKGDIKLNYLKNGKKKILRYTSFCSQEEFLILQNIFNQINSSAHSVLYNPSAYQINK